MSPDRPRGVRSSGLHVTVCDEHGSRVSHPALVRWLTRVAPRRAKGPVTIALVSDRTMRRLNRRYRGKNQPTDVLAFNGHLGDIVIARGVAARQARDYGHRLDTELRVLALHGLLHLIGYDHERDHGRMARAEERLRARGGLRVGLIQRRPVLDPRASTS